jgi:hypothetical protein
MAYPTPQGILKLVAFGCLHRKIDRTRQWFGYVLSDTVRTDNAQLVGDRAANPDVIGWSACPEQDALIRQAADLEDTGDGVLLDTVTSRAKRVVKHHRWCYRTWC